jgi:putative ABC transport system substrate-binding protein
MRRREVIAGLAWTLSAGFAFGQMPGRRPRVVTLWTTTALVAAPFGKQFEEGLTERGWVLGRTLEVDHRFTEGQPERLPSLAAEIVAAKPEVIMTGLNTGAVALRKLTTEIPIVVASALDPVGSGLAQSIARPGWNVTGNVISARTGVEANPDHAGHHPESSSHRHSLQRGRARHARRQGRPSRRGEAVGH